MAPAGHAVRVPLARPAGRGVAIRMADEPAGSTAVVATPPTAAERPSPGPTPPALTYERVVGFRRFLQSWRLARVVRARVAKNSVLAFNLGGSLPETSPPALPFRSAPATSLESVTNALRHAAHDPRVSAVYVRLEGFSCGWAKLQELRRHLDYFRAAGKTITVFMETGGEKEYFVALSADEVFVPPTGMLVLRGFMGGGSFLRGVLEKVGVDPQVQRRGVYKSAGDQLARKDMSDAQREVVESILDATYERFVSAVAEARSKDPADVRAFLDRAPFEMQDYEDEGYFKLKYEDEVLDMLKRRHNDGSEEKQLKAPLKSVSLKKYGRVTDKLLALSGKTRVAVVRASGAITSGKNGSSPVMGPTLGSESVVSVIRKLRLDDKIKAVVLRIDSPGGSALASDVMWREIRKCCEVKPVIASMSDVAASGYVFPRVSLFVQATICRLHVRAGGRAYLPSMWRCVQRQRMRGSTRRQRPSGVFVTPVATCVLVANRHLCFFFCSVWTSWDWLVLGLLSCFGLFPGVVSAAQWLLHGHGVPYDCG